MDNFVFVSEIDGRSGKISTSKARKTIRTHVMRNHWSNKIGAALTKTGSDQEGVQSGSKIQTPTTRTKRHKASTTTNETPEPEINSMSPLSADYSALSDEVETSQDMSSYFDVDSADIGPWSLSRHFTTASDTPVHEGSERLDSKSAEHSRDYAQRFEGEQRGHIQPQSPTKSSLHISNATHDNSAPLIHSTGDNGPMNQYISRDLMSISQDTAEAHPVENMRQDALKYKRVSLSLLNRRIAESPDSIGESSILCVATLLASEVIAGELAAIEARSNELVRMIETFGGIELLSPSVASQVYLTDVKAATIRRCQPSFLLRPYMYERFQILSTTPFEPEDPALSLLGLGFVSPSLCEDISEPLHRCLQYAMHIVHINEQHNTGDVLPGMYGIDEYTTLEHTLLSLPYTQSLTRLEECIRLATLLYSNTAIFHTPSYFSWVGSLLYSLKAELLLLDWEAVATAQPRLLMWMLFQGAHISRVQPEDETEWWISKLRYVYCMLQIEAWSEVKEILEQWLFVDRICGRAWRDIWNQMVSER